MKPIAPSYKLPMGIPDADKSPVPIPDFLKCKCFQQDVLEPGETSFLINLDNIYYGFCVDCRMLYEFPRRVAS